LLFAYLASPFLRAVLEHASDEIRAGVRV